jgi:hypothetical protein
VREVAVAGLNEALLARAAGQKLLRTTRVRADTTVIPANVAYQTEYKIPEGEASRSGFETKQAALAWGLDQEANVRAGTWTDPAAGEITVSEWIDRWKAMQDVGPSTMANREYRIRRSILIPRPGPVTSPKGLWLTGL